MHYLPENNCGFDPSSLGFPSIKGCQAICYQTTRGLYGFHDYKAGGAFYDNDDDAVTKSKKKLQAFASWVASQSQIGETGVAIYGVINRTHQYTSDTAGNQEWGNVLRDLANSLGFGGSVKGARVSSHVKPDDSIYVVYDTTGGSMKIGFKRWSKMTTDSTNLVTPVSQARTRPVGGPGGGFQTSALPGHGKVSPVVRQDVTKSVNLNDIPLKKFVTFQ